MLPPTVAMLRTCRPPITAEACVSAMRFVWKPGCVTTASCVAMAPITYSVGVSPIVSRPSPARLIRCCGAVRPRLIWMMRSVPPARKRAASPCSRAKAIAASIVSGRWNAKLIAYPFTCGATCRRRLY